MSTGAHLANNGSRIGRQYVARPPEISNTAPVENEHSAEASEWDYYARWLASLERLVLELALVDGAEVEARMVSIAHADAHAHDHDHG